MNRNFKFFLLVGFLAYYIFFILSGLLIGKLSDHANGYDSFEIALFFGPFIAFLFAGVLFLTGLSRRKRLSVASISVVTLGATLSAFFAVCWYVIVDLWLSEKMDQRVVGSFGDWMVPVVALVLTAAASYIGVRFATKDA